MKILLFFLTFFYNLSPLIAQENLNPSKKQINQPDPQTTPPQKPAQDLNIPPLNSYPRPTDVFSEPFPLFEAHQQPGHIGHYLLLPLVSQTIPGFGQFYYGQYRQGLQLTGAAISGLALAKYSKITKSDLEKIEEESEQNDTSPFLSKNDNLRYYLAGAKLYGTAGDLSAYYSFRTAVRKNPKYGDFSFLTHEESLQDILYAPLRYEFLTRPSTFGTLALSLIGLYASRPNHLDASDGIFTASISLMAGTGEEALYRGWMQPVAYHYTGSTLMANMIQSFLFYKAHSPRSPVHFLAGLWFGHITQKNNWTLSEAIFIHTWWDVFALSSAFITAHRHPEKKIGVQIELPTIFF